MDCQNAIEYINLYADNMLSKKETELLFSHISSCAKCKKELDYVLAVKKALAGLGEIEPPSGLALSAIKKAKKHRIPVFAYASAGFAAVITLVAVFSSGIFNNNGDSNMQRVSYSAEYAKSMAADAEKDEACATEAPAAGGLMLAPQMEDGVYAASAEPEATLEATFVAPREADVPYITVSAELSDEFKESLISFLNENRITYDSYVTGSNETISFTIREDKLNELKSLIDNSLQYNEDLSAGPVKFIFEK